MTRFPLILAAAVCSTLTVAAPALAGDHRTMAVSAAGIDLASPAGVAMLQARVETAARRVCAPEDWRDARQAADARECLVQAREKGRMQVAALTSAKTRLASAQ